MLTPRFKIRIRADVLVFEDGDVADEMAERLNKR